ncbi:MAG: ATP-binding cassette domain-containing protein [Deltaproteobacteria bacterium]|nr:MAG: ATP-binding cassette domain-containing protein [Deltaproteobacteria bacterium]
MNQPLIQFSNVFKSFGANRVLRGADLSIFRGEITTIIGKSGAGKSVLLKHIIGLMEPDSGEIIINGQAVSKLKKAEMEVLREKFSYVFQDSALFDSMTVFENIALPISEGTSMPKAKIRERVREKMQLFDLHDIDGKYPSQLSGGMKKRVALARALVTDPEIVLFDEPTTGLDPIRKSAVLTMISEYQEKLGFTGVVISHEIPDIFFISQRLAMIDEGRIRFEGSPEEIQRVSDPVVQQFVQGLERPSDDLTGMPTQVQGERRFQEAMARLHDEQITFSVIVLTVENLDEISKELGHTAGQTALKNFANQLQQRLRITDTCARHGLNKLMLVLHNADMERARNFCGKLARDLTARDILERDSDFGVDFWISAGFAEARKDSPFSEVLAHAESKESTYFEFRVR